MSARFDPLTEMTIQRDTLLMALRDVYDKLDAARAELRNLQAVDATKPPTPKG